MTNTASWPEMLTLLINTSGILLCMKLWYINMDQKNSVIELRKKNRLRTPIADATILAADRNWRCVLCRITYHVCFTGVGLWMLFVLDSGSFAGLIINGLLTFIGVVFLVCSWMDISSEHEMAELVENESF